MFTVYIGFDQKEEIAYEVLNYSIRRRSSVPVTILPVKRKELEARGLYTRPRGQTESTDFSLTRFLVPNLAGYRGWSVFMDCDMLCRTDIAELAALTAGHADKAVLVCQHDYVPKTERKFLGQVQTKYPRKNWSSLMLLNNERCTALTPEYVNSASGLELHRFKWIDDGRIGELPLEWNWLVTEYEHNAEAKIVHYTLGGPWFDEYRDCDYAQEWRDERDSMHAQARPSAAR